MSQASLMMRMDEAWPPGWGQSFDAVFWVTDWPSSLLEKLMLLFPEVFP